MAIVGDLALTCARLIWEGRDAPDRPPEMADQDFERRRMNTPSFVDQLDEMEERCRAMPELYPELEALWDHLVSEMPSTQVLVERNRFRLRNLPHMRQRRPRLLIGLINDGGYPNFQTLPLLRFADVVTLTTQAEQQAHADRLHLNLLGTPLPEVMRALPEGFTPDFYIDPQICGASFPPLGLEDMPCVTIAGFCHHFRALHLHNTGYLYDVIAPLSPLFSRLIAPMLPERVVVDTPFGANWGSFEHIARLICFGESQSELYGDYRNLCVALARRFQAAHGDRYNIVFTSNLSKMDYFSHLARAKICLNAVGLHGPYNYRNLEAVNHGAVVMQIESHYEVGEQPLAEFFVPDEEVVLFNADDFEAKALDLLESEADRSRIAAAAQARAARDYTYQAVYSGLMSKAMEAVQARGTLPRCAPGESQLRRALSLFHADDADKRLAGFLAALGDVPSMGASEYSLILAFHDVLSLAPDHLRKAVAERYGFPVGAAPSPRAVFARIAAPGPVDRWNLLIQTWVASGELDLEGARDVLEALARTPGGLKAERSFVAFPAALETRLGRPWEKLKLHHLCSRFLHSGASDAQKDAIFVDCMRDLVDLIDTSASTEVA
jgi:hypothetical protein